MNEFSRRSAERKESLYRRLFSEKWFANKNDAFFFLATTLVGVITSLLTFDLLDGYQFDAGRNMLGVYFPPILTLIYISVSGFRFGFNKRLLFKCLLTYCIQISPFIPLFTQIVTPQPFDDFSRYYLFAKNMLDNGTLYGSDRLYFKNVPGKHYIIQPGYRYFVLLELFLFKHLYRFIYFINIGLYLLSVFHFQKVVCHVIQRKKLQLALLLLLLLFSPYAIKNLLMGIPEWLTVILLFWTCYFYIIHRNEYLAALCLGLVPFFRQNLFITIVLLFLVLLFYNRYKLRTALLFFTILLLPLYHNLYYGGQWRFFVEVFSLPFLSTKDGVSVINTRFIIKNIIHYFGFSLGYKKVIFSPIGALFLPYATVLFFILLTNITSIKSKLVYILCTASAVVPIIFLGTDYYPRFEFINVVIMITTFLLLQFLNKKHSILPMRHQLVSS
jgi:hypothetical protein